MLNFYLYSVSSVSLAAFYVAAIFLGDGLVRMTTGGGLDGEGRQMVASGMGVVVAALPLWLVHWRWLRQQFRSAKGSEEAFHRFYLFTVVCLSAMATLVTASMAATRLMKMILEIAQPQDGPRAITAMLALLLSAGIWLHHWSQFQGGRGQLALTR